MGPGHGSIALEGAAHGDSTVVRHGDTAGNRQFQILARRQRTGLSRVAGSLIIVSVREIVVARCIATIHVCLTRFIRQHHCYTVGNRKPSLPSRSAHVAAANDYNSPIAASFGSLDCLIQIGILHTIDGIYRRSAGHEYAGNASCLRCGIGNGSRFGTKIGFCAAAVCKYPAAKLIAGIRLCR